MLAHRVILSDDLNLERYEVHANGSGVWGVVGHIAPFPSLSLTRALSDWYSHHEGASNGIQYPLPPPRRPRQVGRPSAAGTESGRGLAGAYLRRHAPGGPERMAVPHIWARGRRGPVVVGAVHIVAEHQCPLRHPLRNCVEPDGQ